MAFPPLKTPSPYEEGRACCPSHPVSVPTLPHLNLRHHLSHAFAGADVSFRTSSLHSFSERLHTPQNPAQESSFFPDAHRTELITLFMLLLNLKYLCTLSTNFSRYLSLRVFLLFHSALLHTCCYVIFVSPVSSRVFGITVVLTKRLLHRLLTSTQCIHYIKQVSD